jgi:hypothetical protein
MVRLRAALIEQRFLALIFGNDAGGMILGHGSGRGNMRKWLDRAMGSSA